MRAEPAGANLAMASVGVVVCRTNAAGLIGQLQAPLASKASSHARPIGGRKNVHSVVVNFVDHKSDSLRESQLKPSA